MKLSLVANAVWVLPWLIDMSGCAFNDRLVEHRGHAPEPVDAYVFRSGRWQNITHFPPSHCVYESGVSPSGNWLFVLHADSGFSPPWKMSIYDTRQFREVHAWQVPYSGGHGSWRWVSGDRLLERWGAGQSLEVACLHAVDGTELLEVAGGLESSPTGGFLLAGPVNHFYGYPVVVADLERARVVYSNRPADISELDFESARWSSRSLAVDYVTATDEVKTLRVRLR